MTLSGFVSVFFEKVLKSKVVNLSVWDRNFQVSEAEKVAHGQTDDMYETQFPVSPSLRPRHKSTRLVVRLKMTFETRNYNCSTRLPPTYYIVS